MQAHILCFSALLAEGCHLEKGACLIKNPEERIMCEQKASLEDANINNAPADQPHGASP